MGRFATLALIASVMKLMTDALLAADDGIKCEPCAWRETGLFALAEPARKSGS